MYVLSYQSARDLFEAAKHAAEEKRRIEKRLERLDASRFSLGSALGVVVTSTNTDQNRAAKNIAYIDHAKLTEKALGDCSELIVYALRVLYGTQQQDGSTLGGVCCLLSLTHSELVQLRYLEGRSWKAITTIFDIPRTTAWRMIEEAFDVIDAYGIENTIHGLGIATD